MTKTFFVDAQALAVSRDTRRNHRLIRIENRLRAVHQKPVSVDEESLSPLNSLLVCSERGEIASMPKELTHLPQIPIED